MDTFRVYGAVCILPESLWYVDVRSLSVYGDDVMCVDSCDGYETIGYGRVERRGNSIVAVMDLEYGCPERLDIENGAEIYVCPSFELKGFGGLEILYGGKSARPTILEFHSLRLSRVPMFQGQWPCSTTEML